MTLINYLSRVHFADGVLEIALGSELEVNNFRSAMLVSEATVNKEFSERVASGLPVSVEVSKQTIRKSEANRDAVARLASCVITNPTDVVIAFGSSRALLLADTCCKQVRAANNRIATTADETSLSPELIAIPGVDGVPGMSRNTLQSTKRLNRNYDSEGIQPTAVIFDPTIILGESVERTASSVATTMARCLSAHLSMGYNPPAEGIAADGFRRIVRNLPALLTDDTLEMRRELMAASLNGTLALQKISGIAAELCQVLVESSSTPLDEGALMRLLIAIEADLMEQKLPAAETVEVRTLFSIPNELSLSEWLTPLLSRLPLPQTFDAMGIPRDQLANAANEIASRRLTQVPSGADLCEMLNQVELKNAQFA